MYIWARVPLPHSAHTSTGTHSIIGAVIPAIGVAAAVVISTERQYASVEI